MWRKITITMMVFGLVLLTGVLPSTESNTILVDEYERETSNKCENCYARTVCISGCYANKLNYENCYEDDCVSLFDGIIKYDLLLENKYKLLLVLS